jgi:hypothetical protein
LKKDKASKISELSGIEGIYFEVRDEMTNLENAGDDVSDDLEKSFSKHKKKYFDCKKSLRAINESIISEKAKLCPALLSEYPEAEDVSPEAYEPKKKKSKKRKAVEEPPVEPAAAEPADEDEEDE